ncbi:MAG: glycoside hydrolase family 32 protein [Clostridia bacterium]|nr:glycoside hydrolase family 32 protein [Clostridia bacterium]
MSVPGKRDYRPRIHFTPEKGWINDPNGLIYDGKRYHLFAQYYPDDTKWGPMHWLHAVSDDLLHWTHLPVALKPDALGMIFSGSAAMLDGHVALMYTSHGETEQQSVAFTEDGVNFTPYAGNPVIPNVKFKDYRDPKLFWNAKRGMYGVSVAAGDHVEFFASKDLIHWDKTGEFSDQVNVPGIHECPDLVEMPSPNGGTRWMMVASMIHEGNRTQYVLGDFDGDRFTLNDPFPQIEYMDKGWDNYAPVSFWGTEKPTFMGWANNWLYADRLPQGEYAGMMTLARNAFLVNTRAGVRMGFAPVKQVERAFGAPQPVNGEAALADELFRLNVKGKGPFEVTFSNEAGEVLTVRRTADRFEIDRRKAGEAGAAHEIVEDTYGVSAAPVMLPEDGEMEIIFDVSVLEVYADGGVFTATDLAFPTRPYARVSVSGAAAEISYMK